MADVDVTPGFLLTVVCVSDVDVKPGLLLKVVIVSDVNAVVSVSVAELSFPDPEK